MAGITIRAVASAFWLLLGALPAAAGHEMRRCESAQGVVTFQTAPCADGEAETWRRPLAAPSPPAIHPGVAAAPRRPPSPRPPAARRDSAPSPAARATAAARARCDRARRDADQVRDASWNRLDFRARSELDAEVARACRR